MSLFRRKPKEPRDITAELDQAVSDGVIASYRTMDQPKTTVFETKRWVITTLGGMEFEVGGESGPAQLTGAYFGSRRLREASDE